MQCMRSVEDIKSQPKVAAGSSVVLTSNRNSSSMNAAKPFQASFWRMSADQR